ncbi:MAG: DUF4124 domain-containing protein [Silanimonas sp.]
MIPASARKRSGDAVFRVAALATLALVATVTQASTSAPPNPPMASAAASSVIYRCTAPNGAVALQDDPCPRGHRQELREVAAFAPASVPTASTAPPNKTTTTVDGADANVGVSTGPAPPTITAGEAPPSRPAFLPPPLWRCTDLNGRSRLADAYDPQPRCVPLSVLGVDLSRAPPSAATLCRTIEDDCVELGGDAACAAWEERLNAAESALRSAFSDTQAERRRERDRAKAVIENDCRPQNP